MIHFTYDQAYKIWHDVKQAIERDDEAFEELATNTFNLLDNYVRMCQTIPIVGNPEFSVHDNWARYLTAFYQKRIQR